MIPGEFLVFEGADGTGTTTQSKILAKRLNDEGVRAHWMCEPTSSPIGKLLRQYLRGEVDGGMPSWQTMTLLFAADRQQHQKSIDAILKLGVWVVCDRYCWSTYAYQLAMVEANKKYKEDRFLEWMVEVHGHVIVPDIIYYLSADVDVALGRIEKSGRGERDTFEHREMQDKVKFAYGLVQARCQVDTWAMFQSDDDDTVEKMSDRIWEDVCERFLK